MSELGYLKSVIRHPCASPSPQVVIESAVRAAIPAVVGFLPIDCVDTMRRIEAARPGRSLPNFGRGPRDDPKSPKGGHRSAKAGRGRSATMIASDGAYFSAWQLLGAARSVGAFWFAYRTGVRFAADWASMMYAESGCDLPPDSYAEGGLGPWAYAVGDFHQYGVFSSGPSGRPCFNIGFNHIGIQPGCSCSVSYTASWQNLQPEKGGSVTTRLVTSSGRASAQSVYPGPQGPDSKTVASLAKISGGTGIFPEEVRIEVDNPTSLHLMTSGSWHITCGGRGVALAPLDTCGGPTTIYRLPGS